MAAERFIRGCRHTGCRTNRWRRTVAALLLAPAVFGAGTVAAQGFNFSASSLLLDEVPGPLNAHRGAYEVSIATRPATICTDGVVLTIASDNADVTVSPTTLTFVSSDYTGGRRVLVTAAKDSDTSTDSVTLSHTVTTACTSDYPTSMVVDSVSVTVRDDDRRLIVTPAELAVAEGGTGSYTVALGGSPAAGETVTVMATSTNPAVTVDSDATPTTLSLSFTSTNWNTPQTVTVTAASDADATDEFSTITHAAGEAVWQSRDVVVRVADDEESGTDYDTDDDGLIEIASLAHLNAVRWDRNGDGSVDSAGDATNYSNAFPNAAADMGCPDGPDMDQSAECVGYELTTNLDFDTDGDGDVDANDPGSYANWAIIPGHWSGIFQGNGRTISRLTMSTNGKAGLFDTVTGRVERLGLVDVNIRTTGSVNAGALAADMWQTGVIVACWSSGTVTGTGGGTNIDVGGLVGFMEGAAVRLVASFSTATVSAGQNGGGLVGGVRNDTTILASYSTGAVTAAYVGGLAGVAHPSATVRASYAIGRPTGVGGAARVAGLIGSGTGGSTFSNVTDTYFDSQTTGRSNGAGVGNLGGAYTTSQLQTPTSATGIYADWDELDIDGDSIAREDPWVFGSSTQYPVLSWGGLDPALQFNSQGTNSAPSFGGATVSNQTYFSSQSIRELQVPAATSGNGALTYTAYGLPDGLSFDGDGTGACGQARTVCGRPTTAGNSTVRIVVTDQDDTDVSDRDTLTFTVSVDPPTVELSRSSLALSEGGGAAAEGSWTVRLANLAPTGTVSVAVTSGDPAVALVGAPVTLTFDATTWRTWQMVTARAVDDDNATSERVEVRHTATGANYGDAEAVLRVVVTDDEAPPGAPAGLTATPGDGQATLRWRNPANPSITRYEYRRAEEGARLGSWRAVSGAGPGTTSLTVSGLVNGRAYQFEVRAGNEIGDSPVARTAARLAATPGATVHLQDAALAAAARKAVGKSASEPLTAGDLATVLELDLSLPAPAAGRWLPPQTADEPLRDLRGIEAMVNLRRLWLDNNAVADISPLLALRYLVFVSLRGNPLTSDSVYVHAAALRARGVEVLLDAATLATVADPGLRRALEVALGKDPGATLTEGDLLTLSSLSAGSAGVASLSGLEAASRLESLTLSGNAPAAGGVAMDLSPLAGLRSLSHLDLSDNGLADVAALGGLTGLRELLLGGNALRDLSPLAGLAGLRSLTLSNNGLTDIPALSGLSSLRQLWLDGNELESVRPLRRLRSLIYLHLGDNRIADISPLSSLADLRRLWLPGNRVEDVSALSGLWSLQRLDLSRNQVRDVAPLSRLPDLSRLRLGWNRVEDISALAGHRGLTDGGTLGLRGNPLGAAALQAQVPELRAAGAAVVAGWAVPLFPAVPAAADPSGPSGFVRVLNRSAADGVVLVEALDEAGRRFGPVRLPLPARAAVHFNSADLENGNAAKGMPDGVGRPTRGSWRLAVSSALDIEVLAYLRMPDGFLTAMHGELPRAGESLSAFVFNPGGNRVQRSSLRLHNPGVAEARVWPWGVDDAGRGRLASPLSVAAGVTASVSARSLESSRRGGRGLGNGEGKWRLRLGAPWPLSAVGLLESPTGHLSNLSAAPRQAAIEGTLRLPLFPSASSASGREGFARVANLGPWEGWTEVAAVDDAGVRAGPVRLRLPPRAVVHFNSTDLENGNAAKGLPEGVGAPTRGAWRLELRGNVAFAATAYARHADGFLTSLHRTAPVADDAARVVVFNPASNDRQRSLLRLANDGTEPAQATINARDDAGAEAGPVSVTVPAGEALTLTAAQLENGGEGIDGALGDGEGKWRLTVAFDNPLVVMSLMESPAGHLSNLSAATRP